MPSPPIRVEQGDVVWLVVENTHYFPHSIHLHGVDHPYMDHGGEGNDGVGQTSEMDIMPGKSKTYVIKPRVAGTMYYHCHVQPHTHIPMGLAGMFIVEENRPNNWPQVFNVGAGQVRHPSVAVLEKFSQEYDLHYQSVDKELHSLPQSANDPRLIAKAMNQEYDITDAKDDYFLLNGRSFPYTLRESIIAVKPSQKVKIRVLNGHTENMALHIHGHKATETHYDGIEQNPQAQVTRDVYSLAPAQRVDLSLDTTNDGLHSYDSGLWMFHDHVEKAFTTNGMGEGGSISLVAYDNYIDANGTPKSHGMDLKPYFTKEFWERKIPVWQDYMDEWGSLGAPTGTMAQIPVAPKPTASAPVSGEIKKDQSVNTSEDRGLFSGFLFGIGAYLVFKNKDKFLALVKKDGKDTQNKS
jgi:FtsP/CotA-like multicopper oxidase with cupredoxin domain